MAAKVGLLVAVGTMMTEAVFSTMAAVMGYNGVECGGGDRLRW